MTKASICTIGDEILIGQIVDTNSSHISQALNSIGIRVNRMLSIGDDHDTIISSLEEELKRNEIVIVTGGLGPTKDDITKKALAELSGAKEWKTDARQMEIIQNILSARGIAALDINMLQASVPNTCEVIPNRKGTAPIMVFRFPESRFGHKASLYSLPGVPFEALGAQITPAVQLGDVITINGTTSAIYKMIMTLDPRMAKDVSAPYEEEINHEYPYRSPAQRVVENAVTKEELATAGQTVINGSNIRSGTITLGGDNNGNGQLILVDENNLPIGRWDNSRTVIYDNTKSGFFDEGKFAIIRQEAPEDTPFGVFMGSTQLYGAFFPDQYPNEAVPFIHLNSTLDGSTSNGRLTLFPTAGTVSNPVTRTGGASTNFTATLFAWGRVAMLTIVIQHGSSVGSFGNYFTGTLVDGSRPLATVHAHTSWYEHQILCSLEPDGSIVMRDASGSSSAFNSGTATVTFTYLF